MNSEELLLGQIADLKMQLRQHADCNMERQKHISRQAAGITALKGINKEQTAQIKRMVSRGIEDLKFEISGLEKGHAAFNSALDFAIDRLESAETKGFLSCWREGDWEACQKYGFTVDD